jgi:hypothetical protein
MRQQVNLHQPIFRRERKQFSAITVATTLAVVAVALTAVSVSTTRGVNRLQGEVAELTQRQTEQQEQMVKVAELHTRAVQRGDVQERVRSLTASLSERTQALQVLQSGAAGQTSGFASRIEALAHRHVDGLWIDALAMSGTHNTMSISGGSVDADIVPVYLRGLSSEAALSGTRFDDFVIERPEQGATAQVRFRAGSKSLPVKASASLASTR